MIKLIPIANREVLDFWITLESEFLSLHEEKVGLTLAIEMDVGLQMVIWGSDEDMLIAGINHLAAKQTEAPIPKKRTRAVQTRTKIVEKQVEVKVREPVMPAHWMGKGMGYAILSDGVIETYEEGEIR